MLPSPHRNLAPAQHRSISRCYCSPRASVPPSCIRCAITPLVLLASSISCPRTGIPRETCEQRGSCRRSIGHGSRHRRSHRPSSDSRSLGLRVHRVIIGEFFFCSRRVSAVLRCPTPVTSHPPSNPRRPRLRCYCTARAFPTALAMALDARSTPSRCPVRRRVALHPYAPPSTSSRRLHSCRPITAPCTVAGFCAP
ncbi:hypothetical protein DENSPDRAFT_226032 [Dentipellis sp. KUC8613]|nr:hypothetical protein DENSPDRAFT_226032 [Dentipellis sp. KUC8613]